MSHSGLKPPEVKNVYRKIHGTTALRNAEKDMTHRRTTDESPLEPNLSAADVSISFPCTETKPKEGDKGKPVRTKPSSQSVLKQGTEKAKPDTRKGKIEKKMGKKQTQGCGCVLL